MVPNGWKEVKLGDVISHQKGFAFKSEHYCAEGKRIIRISDTDRNSIHDKSPVYINDNNSAGLERYTLSTGDIILSTVGSRPHLLDSMVGKAVQIPSKDEGALLNQNLVKISPKKKLITNNYLFSMLKKNRFNFFISTLVRGNANQVSITLNELFSYKFLLPTYDEQRKIAKILSTWDKAIATTEKLIESSKQQKKALMQQLLTGKKRLVNPETGKVFQGEWERHAMSDLAFIDRKSLGKKTPDDFKFQYISLSDVAVGSISKELEVHKFASAPSRARRVIQEGDILLSTVRPNLKGFAKVSGNHADCIASTGFSVLTPKKRVSGDYIYQYIFSSHVTGQIDSLVVGSNYPAINSSDVAGLKVYCPTYEEQQKIASVLTTADKEIEVLEAKLDHLKDEKKALMQQLLTGKRRVKVEEMEVA
ncbi:restriction endonuclease subunit S [Vibrio parahaemolyticus]|nr:restriction endonuclease subunit S [Vibrio parahaemolyticus]ELA8010282.1 restriction endonuclease subunit S [Vibrio parahaemolyticus]ELA9111362.1 restriction endonuclease subunit S [Vibrio parahaemolyticus]ELB5873401.1 restriction endonuclease subunit S [Vibrio parahaemolyticus]